MGDGEGLIPAALQYRLSILLVTFNQEAFVARGIESVLMQDFPGPIQVVVADDASSDGTLEVIRRFDGCDGRFHFVYLDSKTNRGVTRNYQRGFAACTGQYVAVLEGDDYWVHPRKLRYQTEFLDDHRECDVCATNHFTFHEERADYAFKVPPGSGHRYLSARDLIAENLVGNFSACVYRRAALEALPAELFEMTSYDWIVNICMAKQSLIGFLNEPMSVYRIHDRGAWSQATHLEKLRRQLDLIPQYDSLTKHVFQSEFNQLAWSLRRSIAMSSSNQTSNGLGQFIWTGIRRANEFLPPVLVSIGKALIPPALQRKMMGRKHKASSV